MKFVLAVFLALIGAALAEDCKYNDVIIKDGGEHLPIGECVRIGCNNGDISALPCPLYGMPHGCNVKYQKLDLTKPYPDCCSKAFCAPEE